MSAPMTLRDALFDELDAPGSITKARIRNLLISYPEAGPRTITTVEELDALPLGSVILDQVGLSLHRNAFTGWCSSNGAKEIPMDMLMQEALPATVLYEPEPTA